MMMSEYKRTYAAFPLDVYIERLFSDCYKKKFSFNLEKWRRSNSVLQS